MLLAQLTVGAKKLEMDLISGINKESGGGKIMKTEGLNF